MADGTSVGKVYLDVKINPKSMNVELSKLSSAFNNIFKNMISKTVGQTSNFAKDTIGKIGDSFRKIGDIGTASSDKVSKSIDKMNKEYQKTQEEIQKIQKELFELDAQRDAIIQDYADMPPLTGLTKDETLDQLLKADQSFVHLSTRVEELEMKMSPLKNKSLELADAIRQVGTETDRTSLKTNKMINFAKNAMKQILKFSLIKKMFTRETRKATNATSGFGNTMKRVTGMLARRLIVYQLLARGIMNMTRYLWSALKTNDQFARSLNVIRTNLLVAFQPIYDYIIPALNALMQAVATVTTYIASAINALFGKAYQQSFGAAKKMNQAIAGMGKSAKKAGKDAKGALAPFDEINQLMTGAGDAGADADDDDGGFEMEMPDLATVDMTGIEKFKEMMAGLFEPFKLAWKAEGQNVIDAAKYALESIKGLISSIAKSWMEVWTGGTGQKMLETILKIIQNIFIFVGNLANAFRKAWEQNEIGTKIIQGLFNIFNTILGTIERITGATAEWAKNLNFGPLLEAINILLVAIEPLINNLGNLFAWLWENVLLPVAGWIVEDLVPVFIEVLAGAISVLNSVLEVLAPLGEWLWEEFLKPLGEWTGGVIIAILEGIRDGLFAISDWITDHQGLVETLTIFLKKTWDAIKKKAEEIWSNLTSFLSTTWTNIKTSGEEIWTAIKTFFADTWDSISTKISEIWNNIKTFLSDTWTSLKEAVTNTWNSIKDFIGNTWDNIKNKTSEIWGNIKTFLIDKIWNPIKNTAKTIWEGIKKNILEPIEQSWTSLKQIWDKIKKYILDKWDEIRQGISNTKDKLVNAIKEPFSIAKDWIDNLIGDAYNWGRNLIGNIVDGIKSMIGRVRNAVSNVANTIKDFLGFSSPANKGPGAEADKWTPNLMEMFAAGIQDNIHKVSSAISATAGTIEQNIQFDTHGMADHIGGAISQSLEGLDIDNGNLTVIVKIGEDTITEKVVSNINRQSRISGRTVITV